MAQSLMNRPRGSATRVLVVDDDADTAVSMAMLLLHAGYVAKPVSESRECLAAAELFAPDVVLLDLAMPHLCGYDLAKQIRALPDSNGIVIVAISGYADFDHVRRSFDSGCNVHLVKPVELTALEAVMLTELKKRHATTPHHTTTVERDDRYRIGLASQSSSGQATYSSIGEARHRG
jgi:CheY-like chemotaxis protein